MFELHTTVAVPSLKTVGAKPTLYPFANMSVGSSFFVPVGAETSEKVMNRTRSASANYRKGHPTPDVRFRVTPAADPVSGAAAVGIWRIS